MRRFLLLCLLAGNSLAASVRLDAPVPGLSDGGPGVLCSAEYVQAVAEADPHFRKTLWLAVPALAAGLLCRPGKPTGQQFPMQAPIPEPAFLLPLGVTLLALARFCRKG